jgi:hypothetical protein
MDQPKKSWRVLAFAARHSVSVSFIWEEIAAARLHARKPAPKTTIITDEDETAWLAAMPDARPKIEAAE